MWHEGGIIKHTLNTIEQFNTIELKKRFVCVIEGDAICIYLLFVYWYYLYVVLLA